MCDNIASELKFIFYINILLCASEAGSPTNRPGSDKTRAGPGILWSVHRWTKPTGEPPTCGAKQEHVANDH